MIVPIGAGRPARQPAPLLQFHLLSFEGPDAYARAGGLASRVSGLARALGGACLETHVWFIGDPDEPGHADEGHLHLHRWCQWISRHHPGGVYDGEEEKRQDYSRSLPPYLVREALLPHLLSGGRAVILAEEWQTAEAVCVLDAALRAAGLRAQVEIFWNANNTFGFERIDWKRLRRAARLTTVSRYMKHTMWALGLDPLVIPNGLPEDAFVAPDPEGVATLRWRFRERPFLVKVARFDPDKRWLLAVRIVAAFKGRATRPLLIARGGVEAHRREFFEAAASAGLSVFEREGGPDVRGMVESLAGVEGADVVVLDHPLGPEARNTLFRAADAVLANSGREPFGLVGLEAMAAGGLTCTGCTGEDYVIAGHNALVLQTDDAEEFLGLYRALCGNPRMERAIRHAGRMTARQFAWSDVVERNLLPQVERLGSAAPADERPDRLETNLTVSHRGI